MSKTIHVAIATAFALSLVTFEAAPAIAASAHNLESSTSTTNAHDNRRTARLKQRRNRRGY